MRPPEQQRKPVTSSENGEREKRLRLMRSGNLNARFAVVRFLDFLFGKKYVVMHVENAETIVCCLFVGIDLFLIRGSPNTF